MNRILACLLAAIGLTTACGQKNYEDAEVGEFAQLVADPNIVVLDVRTSEEYASGHLLNAINIDVQQGDFPELAERLLPKALKVAVYCRSGRRSATAAGILAESGYHVVNLKGGILAWQNNSMPITNDSYATDVFATKSGKMVRMHALMHASIRLEYDGKEIEIDPVTKLGDRVTDYTLLPKADYIFVTHEHADHFDKAAIRLLSSDATQLITNHRCVDMLGHGTALANGDTMQLDAGIKVEAVPAYNITEGHLQFHPKGRDNGFVLTIGGLRIYIAGDTEDIPEMAQLNDIDIAFLPCNQPYTMTPDQLIRAAKTVKPKVLFPYHYGSTDVSSIVSRLDGMDVRLRHYE